MKWGIYDTVDNCWLGNNDTQTGPKLYDMEQFDLARLVAEFVCYEMGWEPTRVRAREFDEGPMVFKDELQKKRESTVLDFMQRKIRGSII